MFSYVINVSVIFGQYDRSKDCRFLNPLIPFMRSSLIMLEFRMIKSFNELYDDFYIAYILLRDNEL